MPRPSKSSPAKPKPSGRDTPPLATGPVQEPGRGFAGPLLIAALLATLLLAFGAWATWSRNLATRAARERQELKAQLDTTQRLREQLESELASAQLALARATLALAAASHSDLETSRDRAVRPGSTGFKSVPATIQDAIAILNKLTESSPASAEFMHQLVAALQLQADLHRQRGEEVEAENALKSAHKVLDAWLDRQKDNEPAALEIAEPRSLTWRMLGSLKAEQGEFQTAIEAYREALMALPRNSQPEVARTAAYLHHRLGYLFSRIEQYETAREQYEAAAQLREELTHDHPDRVDYMTALADTVKAISILQEATMQGEASLASRRRLAELRERIAAATEGQEDYPDHLAHLGDTYFNLGSQFAESGDIKNAMKFLGKAVDTLEHAVIRFPQHREAEQILLNTLWERASLREKLDLFDESLNDWDKALMLAEESPAESEVRVLRARTLALTGAVDDACDEVDNVILSVAEPSGVTCFHCAKVLAICGRQVMQDEGLVEEDRQTLADDYWSQAVDLLRMAGQAGFFAEAANRELLRTEKTFLPIRNRDDFLDLVEQLDETPVLPKPQAVPETDLQAANSSDSLSQPRAEKPRRSA